jgi:DNA-directed RNA polymerase specialized sigma24 family protein
MDCFHECLNGLPTDERRLILAYYEGERSDKIASRRELAVELEIPLNALRIRVCRIRRRVEVCLSNCVEGGANEIESQLSATTSKRGKGRGLPPTGEES